MLLPKDCAVAVSQAPLARQAARGITALVARTLAMRLVTLAGTVVLARILLPADFGVFAVVVFAVTALSVIGDLGVGGALIQQTAEPDDRELSTAWILQQGLWLILFAAVWLAAPLLVELLAGTGSDGVWLVRVMATTLIFTSLRSLPTVMLTRELRFGTLAMIEVAQQIAFYASAIVLAVMGAGAWSFVVAAVLQTALGAGLAVVAWRIPPIRGFEMASATRLLRFGVGFQGSYVLQWLRDGSVPLFGGMLGGATGIGLAQFGWRNGQLVSSLDEVIARVTMPVFSRLKGDPDALRAASQGVMAAQAIIIGAVQWWLVASAPVLIPLVFTGNWTPAVPALQLVALGSLAALHARLLRTVLFAMGAAALAFRISALSLVTLLAAMWLGITVFGLTGVGVAFLTGSVLTLAYHAWALRGGVTVPLGRLSRIGLEGAAGALATFGILRLDDGPIGLALSGVAHLGVVAALTFVAERESIGQIRALIRQSRSTDGIDVASA